MTDLWRDTDPAGWAGAVEVDEAPRRPGTVANRSLESCPPLAEADLGEWDVTGGVSQGECEGTYGP